MHGLANFKFMQTGRQTNRHEHPITHVFDALCAEDAEEPISPGRRGPVTSDITTKTDINEEIH